MTFISFSPTLGNRWQVIGFSLTSVAEYFLNLLRKRSNYANTVTPRKGAFIKQGASACKPVSDDSASMRCLVARCTVSARKLLRDRSRRSVVLSSSAHRDFGCVQPPCRQVLPQPQHLSSFLLLLPSTLSKRSECLFLSVCFRISSPFVIALRCRGLRIQTVLYSFALSV